MERSSSLDKVKAFARLECKIEFGQRRPKLYSNPKARFLAIPTLVSLALKKHSGREALQYAQSWVAQSPANADAYDARGLAYEERQQTDQALDDFNTSVKLNPTSIASEDRDDLLQKSREWKRMTQRIFGPKLEENHHDYDALIRNARRLLRGYSWAQGQEMAQKQSDYARICRRATTSEPRSTERRIKRPRP